MNTQKNSPAFQGSDDWMKDIKDSTSEEMRRGMLAAMLDPKNFDDSFIVSDKYTQSALISKALYESSVSGETMRFGLMLILSKIVFAEGVLREWREHTKKTVFMHIITLLNYSLQTFEMEEWTNDTLRKYLKKFFWEVLITIEPNETLDKEVEMIIKVITSFERDQLLIDALGWLGNELVINDLVSKLPKDELGKSIFKIWDNETGQRLAIHLAAAGHLNHYFEPHPV